VPLQTADYQDHESQADDLLAAATLEARTDQAPEQQPNDQSDEQSDAGHANGQADDAPAAPTVEPPTDQARSFGTGVRQLLQFRRQPQAQDGGEQEVTQPEPQSQARSESRDGQTDPQTHDTQPTERWVSLLAHQGEQPQEQPEQAQALNEDSQAQIGQSPGQQGEQPGEHHEAHLNGQSHDAPSDVQTSRADHDDMQSSHPEHHEHGDHQDHHGDQFQEH
jgi:hypothetical protein